MSALIIDILLWGSLIGVAIFWLCFVLVDKLTPYHLWDEIVQKNVTQKEIKNALNKALAEAPAEGEGDAEGEESAEDETDTGDAQAKDSAVYNTSREYYLKTLEEIPSGTLKGDLRAVYSRLEGVAGEVHDGKELEKLLINSGTDRGDIVNALRKLVSAKLLEPSEEQVAKDAKALEVPDEDMEKVEQDEFHKNFSHAYNDYKSSLGDESPVDFG